MPGPSPAPSPSAATAAAAGQFKERFDQALLDIRGHYERATSQGDGQTAADLVGAVEALSANFKPKPLTAPVATPTTTAPVASPTTAPAAPVATPSTPATAAPRGSAANRSGSRHNKKAKEDVCLCF